MQLSVKILFLFMMGALISSCLPNLKSEKGPLLFSEGTITSITPLEANYDSLKVHLIEKSCLSCHKDRDDFKPAFITKQDLIDNADDIIFYVEEGCDLGSCMPPLLDNGTSVLPIPSPEVMQAFKDWIKKQS